MALYLDTGRIDEVEKFLKMGVISGVTTNPSILLKSGITGGMDGVKNACQDIAKMIYPMPLSVELFSNDDPESMIEQAKELHAWAENTVIKVPIHGVHGELFNLQVIHELETKHKIPVNVTAIMNAQQAFLAAQSGASYVSLFCGRVNDMGYNSLDEISRLRKLLDAHDLKAKIICASTREVLNVIEWLSAGAHIVTVLPDIFSKMVVHPYTKETVKMFLDEGKKIQQFFEALYNRT